ncbi:hypothetical protein FXN61_09550 [Lentzea sp. PSKA42]|uniref:Neocarzinostatin family protein n=1 Tax=Lentzea indica TaxID=2604800 RepID=A0ABX1FDM4_9PSEU|nr:hypothetical protein [Lentzea indica]NKE57066.1 hypothetical protein [Lentzea indica]
MRSQFMAPVYALLISLGVALALGAAMEPADAPNQPEQQQGTLTIRLVTEKTVQPGRRITEAADGLKGTPVTIQPVTSEAELTVGMDGTVKHTLVDGPLRVCLPNLPKRWTGVNVAPDSDPQAPCWNVDPRTGPFNLVVKEG